MESRIYSPLIEVQTYRPFQQKPLKYVHIKESDYPSGYNEAGLLLVAGMMLENRQLDLIVINETPFTQENMRTKSGRFVWSRYVENSVNAYNIDVLREFISFARDVA